MEITPDEFAQNYAKRSALNINDLKGKMVVMTCNCDYDDCNGYQMVTNNELLIKQQTENGCLVADCDFNKKETTTYTGMDIDVSGIKFGENGAYMQIGMAYHDEEGTEKYEEKQFVGLNITTKTGDKIEKNAAFIELLIYILQGINITGRTEGLNGSFLEITLPCEHKYEVKTFDDFPFETVPCTCGNPKHFFIKYETTGKQ